MQINYVLPYINPDTDGVCAAIAYSVLNPQFTPVIFGDFDQETTFVLNTFQVPFPDRVVHLTQAGQIVLVDTHHANQLPEIDFRKVTEVIDHHPAGDDSLMPNAKIQNEEVGAACTLIVERMQRQGIMLEQEIAGILALAIVSNTLNFVAPSTSVRDRVAFNWLREIVPLHDEIIVSMFRERSNIQDTKTEELLLSNTKVFDLEGRSVAISQLELVNVKDFLDRSDLPSALVKVQNHLDAEYLIVTTIDIINHTTSIEVIDTPSKELVENALSIKMGGNRSSIDRILLRKTDFVPQLKKFFSDARNP